MKKNEIKVGGHYLAKVNGRAVEVKVDRIEERSDFRGRTTTTYHVTSLKTGRRTTFRSAQKFQGPVGQRATIKGSPGEDALPAADDAGSVQTFDQVHGEAEQRPDPTDAPTETTAPASSPAAAAAPAADPEPSANGSTPLSRLLRRAVDELAQPVEVPEVVAGKTPTPEQRAILGRAAGLGKGDVLVVEAGAGTGKTSTLQMLEAILKGRGQYTAFNRSLVMESKAKFRKAACNTTHSLAFREVGKDFSHRLEGPRMRSRDLAVALGIENLELKIGTKTGEDGQPQDVIRTLESSFLAGQVVTACRRFCQSADKAPGPEHFRYIDGIDQPSPGGQKTYANNERVREYLAPFAAKLWADQQQPDGSLPYNADCYVKMWELNGPHIAADYIMLDEAQDTAPVMLSIVEQQRHALVILVGDSAQSIYEWRGAVNAMAAFPEAPREFLSQSFRFGPAIAQAANQILELIPGVSLRLRGLPTIDSKVVPVANPRAILCRTNAAAVGHLLREVSEGKKPFLVGGGSDVVEFVEAAQDLQQGRPTQHPELSCFGSWKEVVTYSEQDEGEDLKLLVKLIGEFGCAAILGALKHMPLERDSDLVICTAHKSKGREWESVKLASDFPTKKRSGDAELKLIYVAVTRAKLLLDVSECPFFTGEDALEIIPPAPEATGLLPPAPAAPIQPAAPRRQEYSWAKARSGNGWNIRGPLGAAGQTVTVTRRDGSTSEVRLGKVIWQDEAEGVALYEKN